jgi:[histone H3]-lysine36 N-dimethyltransferase SETMAR
MHLVGSAWRCVLYYELLQPSETVTADRYQQQLIQLRNQLEIKRPEWADRHDKVILLHDNARPHVAKSIKDTLKDFKWEVLTHPPYSPDIAPSDYHLFRSMAHGLAEQRFQNRKEVQKWLDEWIASKPTDFFYSGIHKLPNLWENVVFNDGNYF